MTGETKRIMFVTGTRADFGKLEPLIQVAQNAGYAVGIWVTGMHMLDRYGLTKMEVHRTPGVLVHEFLNQREGDPYDLVLAKTVLGFSDFVSEHQPDLVVVHGDRVEALACSLVCATNYIRCAHVEGGEVSGTIDELFRHCNSKLAHSHFVSSQAAADRVRRLGEDEATIYVIGSPELDFHAGQSGVAIQDVKSHYEIPFDDYGVCTFHPVTSEVDSIGTQAADLFAALEASGRHFVVILPNNDPGSDQILRAIEDLPLSRFRTIPSMRFAYFSELMKNASCIVGNSSAGVREAPFLGVPSLDVGTRQSRRSEAGSITTCRADDAHGISGFLDREWGKTYSRDAEFGEGRAAERFIEVLRRPEFWGRGFQKSFSDYGG